MTAATPLFFANNFSLQRGGRILLQNLDIVVNCGTALHVTGPNGLGKTSLLRYVAAHTEPKTRIFLPASDHYLKNRENLGENLRFWAKVDFNDDQIALERFQLTPLENKPVGKLSAGQRQRAHLSRLLAGYAPLWILDEPLNNLDAQGAAIFEDILRTHLQSGGAAIVASHRAISGATPFDLQPYAVAA